MDQKEGIKPPSVWEVKTMLYTADPVDNRFCETAHRHLYSVDLKMVTFQNSESVFFSFFQKLFSDSICSFHVKISNWNSGGNLCCILFTLTLHPESLDLSNFTQAESTYLLLPKRKQNTSPAGNCDRRSLGVLEDLAGAYLPLRFC